VRGITAIVGMLVGVFTVEDDKDVPWAGDPVRVVQVVLNGTMFRGEGGTRRQIYIGNVGMVNRGV